MTFKSAITLAAALALSATAALAQPAPGPQAPAPQFDHAQHHAEMCTNMYAFAVGGIAALEVRLNLTPVQKPLFERWKAVKLSNAKAQAAHCTDNAPMGPQGSILERRQRQIARLELRLADLKAETPALEALVKSLDANQQEILLRAAHEGGQMGMMHRWFNREGGPMHMHHGDGPEMH